MRAELRAIGVVKSKATIMWREFNLISHRLSRGPRFCRAKELYL